MHWSTRVTLLHISVRIVKPQLLYAATTCFHHVTHPHHARLPHLIFYIILGQTNYTIPSKLAMPSFMKWDIATGRHLQRIQKYIMNERETSRLYEMRSSMDRVPLQLSMLKWREPEAYWKTMDQSSTLLNCGLKPGLLLNDIYRLQTQLGYDWLKAVWWLCKNVRLV